MTAVAHLSAEHIARGVSGVATLPSVYFKITDIIHRPDVGIAEVGRIVKEDVALTGKLLRLVNSSLFGLPKRIDTVPDAIKVVGMTQLQDLALGTSVLQLFRDVPADMVNMDSFWRHSVACAIGARLLAQQRKEPNVERFFVAGLLHDIGRPVIFTREADAARTALERAQAEGRPLRELEREVLGFDHAAVGGELLKIWNIAPPIIDAVRLHHMPVAVRGTGVEAAALHVADVIANALGFGTSGERFVPPLLPQAWDALGLDAGVVPDLLKALERQHQDVCAALLAAD